MKKNFFFHMVLVCLSLILLQPLYGQKITNDSIVTYLYNQIDSVRESVERFTYDDDGNLIQVVTQAWNTNTGRWQNSTRTMNSYDGGLLTETNHENWSGNQWAPHSILSFTYNGLRQIVETLDREYSEFMMSFEPRFRERNDYENGYLVRQVFESWDAGNSSWAIARMVIRTLNEQGQVKTDTIYDTVYQFPGGNASFEKTVEINYYYDDNSLLVSRRRTLFSPGGEESLSRDTFLYDENGFQTFFQSDFFEPESMNWIGVSRVEQTANSDGLLESKTNSTFDFFGGMQWRKTTQTTYEYAGLSSLRTRTPADTLVYRISSLVFIDNIPVLQARDFYYYSVNETTSAFQIPDVEDVLMYPNPTTDHVYIIGQSDDVSRFEWLSMDGRMIESDQVENSRIPVPASTIKSPGSFILVLKSTSGAIRHSGIIMIK